MHSLPVIGSLQVDRGQINAHPLAACIHHPRMQCVSVTVLRVNAPCFLFEARPVAPRSPPIKHDLDVHMRVKYEEKIVSATAK